MLRIAYVLMAAVLLAFATPAAVLAAPAPGASADGLRADRMARALRENPVYVTDHMLRAVPPDTGPRVARALDRLDVPYYVVVFPASLESYVDQEKFAALLYDRLNRPGLYLVLNHRSGAARMFGGGRSVPAKDALMSARSRLPSDAGVVKLVDTFVQVILDGTADERLPVDQQPKSRVRIQLDRRERQEAAAAAAERAAVLGGTALGALATIGLLTGVGVRRGRTRKKRGAK
ncbi:hypothetical protein [Actinomadura rifamycini]|uniref:hypothetical protein n=1 Tax=Actinomadura rifamycini TaxID=31962 RepID=UPI0003FF10E0|nr:hypothetical protein [Actinomadura rifamycini]